MASKDKAATPTTKTATADVAVFSKAELIANAKELKTSPEIMAGALVAVNKDKITKKEATDAVKAYTGRVIGRSKK